MQATANRRRYAIVEESRHIAMHLRQRLTQPDISVMSLPSLGNQRQVHIMCNLIHDLGPQLKMENSEAIQAYAEDSR